MPGTFSSCRRTLASPETIKYSGVTLYAAIERHQIRVTLNPNKDSKYPSTLSRYVQHEIISQKLACRSELGGRNITFPTTALGHMEASLSWWLDIPPKSRVPVSLNFRHLPLGYSFKFKFHAWLPPSQLSDSSRISFGCQSFFSLHVRPSIPEWV